MLRAVSTLTCALINAILAFICNLLGWPIYLDTAGTIFMSAIGGLLPGIVTAVVTNLVCCLFNDLSIYFVIINILIAIFTAWFVHGKKYQRKSLIPVYILILTIISGGLGMAIQWGLLGRPQFDDVALAAEAIADQTDLSFFSCSVILNLGLNLFDKLISSGLAFGILHFVPLSVKSAIKNSSWKQRPLGAAELRKYTSRAGENRASLKQKLTVIFVIGAVSVAMVMTVCGLSFYFKILKMDYREDVINVAEFVVKNINGDSVESYLASGAKISEYSNAEYRRVNDILCDYQKSISKISYIYVYQVRADGCYLVFDTDPASQEESYIGEYIGFDEAFLPYLSTLLEGGEVDVIESNDSYGYLMTAYKPIYDSNGKCVAYAGADASLSIMTSKLFDFGLRLFLIFIGFIILILAFGLWVTDYDLIYPIKSMAGVANDFIQGEVDQKTLDDNVRKIRSLEIRTQDEIEDLYQALCKMSADMAEQMRDLRHYADSTTKMQNGLIITMADMVENRDSDTGAHVQKTAAYVKIILEGLRKHGYYLEKLTPKYISDVVMSAPLHDVGKINISDTILNFKGKLSPEDYEIMKTHTTHGKEIIEKAISTVKGESYLKEARNMAAYHHERWDGKGYPEGLHGEVIPLSARVMAVADVFDALTSARVYKPAFPVEKALDILREGSGSQFDAKCVEVFMDSLPEVLEVLKKFQES